MRDESAQMFSETPLKIEPTHVGCYFLNELLPQHAESAVPMRDLSRLRPHFQLEPIDGHDLHRLAGFDWRIADGIPPFAFDENFSSRGIDTLGGRRDFAEHCFAAGADRQKLRAQTRADEDRKSVV